MEQHVITSDRVHLFIDIFCLKLNYVFYHKEVSFFIFFLVQIDVILSNI